MRRAWPYLVALAAMGTFLVVSLRHLDGVPQVYEDEPWQASTAYSLATRGVFGSDLFAGFYAMDQRYYGFMPLHPLAMAAVFKLSGVGLVQARLESVAFSAATLLLTFLLGRRLFGVWVAALAVVILVGVRWTGLTYVQPTGIAVVDFARIARYDPLVPAVGLVALHAFLSRRYAVSGVLAGAAGLAHVYGLFWVPALALLALFERRVGAAGKIVAAAALAWLPYAAYVARDLPDWRGQTAIYASRFELLQPAWYLDNLAQEFHRYGPGLGPPGSGWLLRPGFWVLALTLPIALVLLARHARTSQASRAVVVPAVLFPILFALFIHLKLVNYTLIELPLFALAVAWAMTRVWHRQRLRPLIAVVALAVLVEGGFSLARVELAARTTTPYATFIARVRQSVPAGARILGLHTYWFCMQDFDYRSFLVPLNWADEGLPLDQGLDRVAPDVVLLDARMRAYFDSVDDGERFRDWLARQHASRLGSVDDATYGLMEIYRVDRP